MLLACNFLLYNGGDQDQGVFTFKSMKFRKSEIEKPRITIFLEYKEAKFLDNHPDLKDQLVGEMYELIKAFIKKYK